MIYEQLEQPLLRTANRLLKNSADAEDAVQTTFIKLFKGVHQFRFKSSFNTYVFRILINTCYSLLQKDSRQRTVPLSDTDSSAAEDLDLSISLESAINKLPDQMRTSFSLFAIEGFKQKEIAEIMGLSLGGVKSNIYQAKCRLRSMLAPSLQGEQK